MSPGRRLLLGTVAAVAVVLLAFFVLGRVLTGDTGAVGPSADQSVAGPVLLVPGYGGSTASLEVLAQSLRAAGREASVVPLPGDGTGDLSQSVATLDAAAASSTLPVDVIGYSAGGVVARLWVKDDPSRARRVITLGSPHHGTRVAALAASIAPGACPVACTQLVPQSPLLEELNDGDETPDGPRWLSLWTRQDETVTPPDSARLDGAVNLELQELCPGLSVTHAQLPRDPVVTRVVLAALSGTELAEPGAASCT